MLSHSRTHGDDEEPAGAAVADAVGRRPAWRRAIAPGALGLLAGTAVIGAATYPGSWFPSATQGPWYFTFPLLGSEDLAHWQASAAYLVALVVLGISWAWLLRIVRSDVRFPAWVVLAVFAVWSAPFLVGPPVSSDDVVIYAGVGRLLDRGLDPYEVGVSALGPDPVVAASSSFWRDSPAPYGPLYLEVTRAAAVVTPDSFRSTVLVLRAFGFVCLVLLALPLASLARRAGRTPAFACTAVLCSPLVLVQLVGAAHNETLMALLLAAGVAVGLAGLAAAERRRRVVYVAGGVALCGLAAAVKLPALLGAVLLGWLWSGPVGPTVRRLAEAAFAGALASLVLVAVSVGSGLGLGWVTTLDVPQKGYTVIAPFTAFGVMVQQGLSEIGWSGDGVLSAFRSVGMVIGIAVAGAILLRADRLGPLIALGSALMVLAWTTPVVWPWYLFWGIVFVGAVTMPVALQVVIIGLGLVLTPLGPGALDSNMRPNASAAFVTLLFLIAAALAARRLLRPARHLPPRTPTAQGADVVNA